MFHSVAYCCKCWRFWYRWPSEFEN